MLLDLAEPAWLAQTLAQYWREAPELLPAVRKECRQLFSGMGRVPLASAWHHPRIRELRRRAHKLAEAHLRAAHEELQEAPCARVVSCMDALVVRTKWNASCKPEEQWHRDRARGSDDRAVYFGGWMNLGAEDDFFECVPGSHAGGGGASLAPVPPRGFVRAPVPDGSRTRRVRVAPGQLLIFCERLLHTVQPNPSRRLFTAFTTASAQVPLPPWRAELEECVRLQGPGWIKSGETLPLLPGGGKFAASKPRKAAAHKWALATLEPAVAAPLLQWCASGGPMPRCPDLASWGAAFEPYSAEDREVLGLEAEVSGQ